MKQYYIYEHKNVFHVECDNKNFDVKSEDFEDILMKLIDLGGYVYIWECSIFLESILTMFKKKGYSCVPPEVPIKECSSKTIRPTVCEDMSVIKIDVVGKGKKSAKIFNADRIVKTKDPEMLKEIMKYGSKKRPQCTMPSICRYAWERWGKNTPFLLSQYLPNASDIPLNEIDGGTLEEYCRKSYRGGFLYSSAKSEKKYKDVYVYDINAMYTYIMRNFPMPVGNPVEEKGYPSKNLLKNTKKGKSYYFIHVKTKLKLKKDGLPCLRLGYDDYQRYYHERDYLTTSKRYNLDRGYGKDEQLELWLTCTDWELVKENYDLSDLEIVDHVWFITKDDLFRSYNNYFYKMKTESDGVKKQVGKNFNNFIAGNMARKITYTNAVFDFDDPIVDEETGEILSDYSIHFEETRGGKSYIYIGSAITSYGRRVITDLIKKNRDRWVYTDTDSVHLVGKGIKGIKEDDKKLGAVKVEHEYEYVYYYSKKRYLGYDKKEKKVTGAFTGISDHDKSDLLNVINNVILGFDDPFDNLVYTDEKTGAEYRWYSKAYYKKHKEIFDYMLPYSSYTKHHFFNDDDDMILFDYENFMKDLNLLKILTTKRICKNFKITRIEDEFSRVENLGYNFI